MLVQSMRPLILLLAFFVLQVAGNYFKAMEQLLISEKAKLATGKLAEDLAGGADNPKEITIHCPTEPEVTIRDLLHSEAIENGDNTCMVVNMKGPNFSLKFSMNCDGSGYASDAS